MSLFENVNVTIPVEESIYIDGVLTTKRNNQELIIYIHGFGGTGNSITSFNLGKAIQTTNLRQDIFCFKAYSSLPERRPFLKLTMEQQAKDLEKIIEYFKKKYEKIHIFANSMGAIPVAMIDTTTVESILLMDPAFVVAHIWESDAIIKIKDQHDNEYLMNTGLPGLDLPFCVSLEHKKEGLTFNIERGLELLSNLQVRTLIATAGKSVHGESTCQLLKKLPTSPNIHHSNFKYANHQFSTFKENSDLIYEYVLFLKKLI